MIIVEGAHHSLKTTNRTLCYQRPNLAGEEFYGAAAL